ncbi:MAG: 3-hydroxy-3-methylglutaryl-CoA reductase [Candidatus Omnitrophica bacterium]|nr:3-hydroxy-3-methylglutaryl-CoA reductase [Candidatus Omnitrophota bacterium]
MPISKDFSKRVIESVLKNKSPGEFAKRLKVRLPKKYPLPESIHREKMFTRDAQAERIRVLEKQGAKLEFLTGKKQIDDAFVFEGNVENYLGLAQIPVGVIGPLRINGLYAHGDFYVPLATTEGALVASYNRGAKVISLSGGARTLCLLERVSRAPGFTFNDLIEASKFIIWVVEQFNKFQEVAKGTTSHGNLEDIKITVDGNQVYINFEYTTGDAAGQNMVTIATDAVCKYIMKQAPVKPRFYFIESNMSGDKKATALSYLSVRGKKVSAEVEIERSIFMKFLHTTPEMMMEYWKMSFVGGVQSGSIGVQGHYANGLAAIFIACGQDAACVSEAAMGITRVDVTKQGNLYIAVTLPNLIVGTVGGGTRLPTQSECLNMLGCKGEGTSRKFAEICAATVLAGEISIMGALAAGQFAQAHLMYGRKSAKK